MPAECAFSINPLVGDHGHAVIDSAASRLEILDACPGVTSGRLLRCSGSGARARPLARGIRAQIDEKRQDYEEPFKTGHVVAWSPVPERRIGQGCPWQQ